MRTSGYLLVLFFLWLPNAELAVARVENRARQGGHPVPPTDVRRRYAAGLRNFFRVYRPIADSWGLYDASRLPPRLIASERQGNLTVTEKGLLRRIEEQAETNHEEAR